MNIIYSIYPRINDNDDEGNNICKIYYLQCCKSKIFHVRGRQWKTITDSAIDF